MEPIWMEHDETGGKALLPDIEAWRARGWNPTGEPPPEPDLTKDPLPEAPPSEGLLAEQTTADADLAPSSKTAKSKKTAAEQAPSEEK